MSFSNVAFDLKDPVQKMLTLDKFFIAFTAVRLKVVATTAYQHSLSWALGPLAMAKTFLTDKKKCLPKKVLPPAFIATGRQA